MTSVTSSTVALPALVGVPLPTSGCGTECAGSGDSGCEVWYREFKGAADAHDLVFDVAIDSLGNVIAVGLETTTTSTDIWIRKYAPDGDTLWTQYYDASFELATAVAIDSDDSIVAVGATQHDVWVGKYSPDGELLWTRTHDGDASINDIAHGVAIDSSGCVVVVGIVDTPDNPLASREAAWLAKYDSDGIELAARTYTAAGGAGLWSVAVDSADNITVAGYERFDSGDGSIEQKIVVRRLSGVDMAIVWELTGPVGNAFDIATDSEDSVVVGGSEVAFDGGLAYEQPWLRKYDSSGTMQWTRSAEDGRDGQIRSVATHGNAVIAGGRRDLSGTNGSPARSTGFVAVHDAEGNDVWEDSSAISPGSVWGVAVDMSGNIVAAGTCDETCDGWLRKYTP